jgi:hypothetical protein
VQPERVQAVPEHSRVRVPEQALQPDQAQADG